MRNFQKLITERRKGLKLTQKDLAEKLNISDKTVSKWETGKSYPDITIFSTLAKVLEMDVKELLEVDDFKEKTIDLEEVESYDYEVIEKYKNKTFINIGLIIASIILVFSSLLIEDENFKVLLIAFGLILSIFSVILFISNNSNYRSFYTKKFYTRMYDYLYSKYASLTLIIFASPFLLMALMVSSINLFNIKGIINLISLILAFLSIYINLKIFKSANFTVKIDRTNKWLSLFALLLFLTVVTNLLLNFILPIVYLLLYIVIFRKSYKE